MIAIKQVTKDKKIEEAREQCKVMRANGVLYKEIASYLNSQGFTNSYGDKITAQTAWDFTNPNKYIDRLNRYYRKKGINLKAKTSPHSNMKTHWSTNDDRTHIVLEMLKNQSISDSSVRALCILLLEA